MAKTNHRNKQKVPHPTKGQPAAQADDTTTQLLQVKRLPTTAEIKAALKRRDSRLSTLVREYVDGAQGSTIKDRADTRMIELQQDVMEAKGVVSMTVKALAASEHDIEMECALRAAYSTLDGLFDDLDPVVFWREARAVSHA